MFEEVDESPFLKITEAFEKTSNMTKYTIFDPKVQELLKSDQKFDLVISEMALNEAVLGKKVKKRETQS